MRRFLLPLGPLLLAAAVAAGQSEPQSVVPIPQPDEQQIEILGGGEIQQVEQLDDTQVQGIMHHEPPSQGAQAAHTAGKVAMGVLAAAVSVGVMAASLLFI